MQNELNEKSTQITEKLKKIDIQIKDLKFTSAESLARLITSPIVISGTSVVNRLFATEINNPAILQYIMGLCFAILMGTTVGPSISSFIDSKEKLKALKFLKETIPYLSSDTIIQTPENTKKKNQEKKKSKNMKTDKKNMNNQI